jgi:hypothetical protein
MKIDRTPMPYLLKLIWQRRSIRRFLDKPVSREKLLLCLEAARWAPSAENVQPWPSMTRRQRKNLLKKFFPVFIFPPDSPNRHRSSSWCWRGWIYWPTAWENRFREFLIIFWISAWPENIWFFRLKS